MNLTQTIRMAFKSIVNNKVRSILTMLGVIIGVASVITLVTMINGMQQKVFEDFMSMGTNVVEISYWDPKGTVEKAFKDYSDNELSEYVSVITRNARTQMKVRFKSKSIDTNIYFADEYYLDCNNVKITQGRALTYSDMRSKTKVAVIGERARIEFFGAMNPIGQSIKLQGENYTVVGLLEEKSDGKIWSADDCVLVPYTMQRKLTGSSEITSYMAKAKDGDATKLYVEKLNAYMLDKVNPRYGYFSAYSNNQWIEQANQSTQMMSMVAAGIAGISLVVGGIGIMNIMLVSVTERTREIGIRMAIGARRRDIIMQFLIEAGAVSAFGGIIGIIVGVLLTVAASYIFFEKSIFLPSPVWVIGSFLFSALLGIIFGLYPANKASKLQPVDALRTQ